MFPKDSGQGAAHHLQQQRGSGGLVLDQAAQQAQVADVDACGLKGARFF